jgi:hypothetical protein
MKINKNNMPKPFTLDAYQNYKIRRLVKENPRKGSNQNNCSGYNLWNRGQDNITVVKYQQIIKETCDKNDPQYSESKHLKYDIEHGWAELIPPS